MNVWIPVGFWYSEREPGYPRPETMVDLTWEADERDRVVAYLKAGVSVEQYRGFSSCRLCKKWNNGSQDYSDFTYVWPEGFAHYVEAHGVKPPEEFLAHLRANRFALPGNNLALLKRRRTR